MSSYCSEWMVINESEDEKSENSKVSKKSELSKFSKISETLQNEELVDVQELMQKLKIEESKNLSLSQENLSLRAQNDQLNDLNSSLIDENHQLRYCPGLNTSQYSISSISDAEDFFDFDFELGLGVECRKKRKDQRSDRCKYCKTIVPQIEKFYYHSMKGRKKVFDTYN